MHASFVCAWVCVCFFFDMVSIIMKYIDMHVCASVGLLGHKFTFDLNRIIKIKFYGMLSSKSICWNSNVPVCLRVGCVLCLCIYLWCTSYHMIASRRAHLHCLLDGDDRNWFMFSYLFGKKWKEFLVAWCVLDSNTSSFHESSSWLILHR